MNNAKVLPLFSSPVVVFDLSEENINLVDKIKNLEFIKSSKETNSMITRSITVLENFEKEKKIFLEYFYKFMSQYLLYENTNFSITTSWATKITKNSYSDYHCHKNSFFSGVYYEGNNIFSPIEFINMNMNLNNYYLSNPSDWNLLNSTTYRITPENKNLIFFPSYLYHKVCKNNTNTIRYSLAFNIIPVGNYGEGESVVNIKFNNWDLNLKLNSN